jgi:hypothetical protein
MKKKEIIKCHVTHYLGWLDVYESIWDKQERNSIMQMKKYFIVMIY